jgi:hypothetical protein
MRTPTAFEILQQKVPADLLAQHHELIATAAENLADDFAAASFQLSGPEALRSFAAMIRTSSDKVLGKQRGLQ